MRFDAVLLLSFGGPERPEDVMPFLRRVVRGRGVPDERLEVVAAQYRRLGGRSPINDRNRALLAALRRQFPDRRVYWGNRNWHPLLAETVAAMRDDGVERAAVFATSAYSSYSGCRQYLEDLEAARAEAGPTAPRLVKLRPFFDHPGFVDPLAEGLAATLARAADSDAVVLMSAHSLPAAMAARCRYQSQLAGVAGRVAAAAGLDGPRWQVVYQSRSGPPGAQWLGPDVLDAIAAVAPGTETVVVAPIGFVSDHMEVVHDLDTVAAERAAARGLRFFRSPTPGEDPRFAAMVRELVEEAERSTVLCPPGCCPPGAR